MPRVRRVGAEAWFVVAAGVATLGLFFLVKDALIDDAYITLAYAKNLGLHGTWGIIPHETANTATSPLNVLALGLFTAITRSPIAALAIVSVIAGMVTAWCWTRIARALSLPLWVAGIGVVLAVANPLVLSALGLEVLLVVAALTALTVTALERRPGWFGIVAGLTLLVRVDLVAFVIVFALASPAVRSRWRRALAGLAATALPWFLFSWVLLGSALPDTALIKTDQKQLFSPYGYVSGPTLYFIHWHGTVSVAFIPALLGLMALVAWLAVRGGVRWRPGEGPPRLGAAAALGGGGVAYFLLLAGLRVPPYHWYYVPVVVSLSSFLVIAAGVWLRDANVRPMLRHGPPRGLAAVVALLAVLTIVRDVKAGLPWSAPLVTSNFADASDYKRIALDLRRRIGSARITPGEVGTIAYYCDCQVSDPFTYRAATVQEINRRIDADGAIRSIPWKLNYLWLDRNQKPEPIAYHLLYQHGPGSGPNTWQVWSPWLGTGHFTLLPGPMPPRRPARG